MPDLPKKTKDPLEIARWILDRNDRRAPIDMVRFATLLKDKFGGLEGLADKLADLYEDVAGQSKVKIIDMVDQSLRRAADQQEAEFTAGNLTNDQLASCLRHVILYASDTEQSAGDGVDSFGT